MSSPKFKIGDLVWAKGEPRRAITGLPAHGDLPAVVTGIDIDTFHCNACDGIVMYRLDIIPPGYVACQCVLRPRRDDYQQHEGLGSMDKIKDALPEDEFDTAVCRAKVTYSHG